MTRRFRFSLRTVIIAVALLGAGFAMAREFLGSAPIRAAERALVRLGPSLGPAFALSNYRARSVTRSASRCSWKVHFVRVGGNGAASHDVVVSDSLVQQARFLPW